MSGKWRKIARQWAPNIGTGMFYMGISRFLTDYIFHSLFPSPHRVIRVRYQVNYGYGRQIMRESLYADVRVVTTLIIYPNLLLT